MTAAAAKRNPYYQLEHYKGPVGAGTFFSLPIGGLAGELGIAGEADAAAADQGATDSTAAKTTGKTAAVAAGSSLLKSIAKDATVGAVLADLTSSGSLKYMAIWTGLFVLGLVLIVKGLGFKTPSPTRIIPVPA